MKTEQQWMEEELDSLLKKRDRLKKQVAKLQKENDELHELDAHYREQMAMLSPRGTG